MNKQPLAYHLTDGKQQLKAPTQKKEREDQMGENK